MAKFTEDNVYRVEHNVISDYASVFDYDNEKDIAMKAVFLEGVHTMANAIVNALEEVKNV